jgi:membrane protein required for colicin V production
LELVDIGILVAILIPALVGVLYGFLNIVISIVAWGVSFCLAVIFHDNLSPVLASYVETEILRDGLAFLTIFILCLIIFSALGFFMLKLVGRAGLTGMDRILGFIFGLGLGATLVSLLVFLSGFTGMTQADWWQDSLLIRPFEMVSEWGRQFLPDNIATYHSYGSETN